MESICELMRRRGYDPAHGKPAPLAEIYAANTCTASEFERESKRLELQSRKAWAEQMRRQREDIDAASWAASHAGGAGSGRDSFGKAVDADAETAA